MKKLFFLSIMAMVLGCMNLAAQTTLSYQLDVTTNDSTIYAPGNSHLQIVDDGGLDNVYTCGHDFHFTLHLVCDTLQDSTGTLRIASLDLNRDALDIDCRDTLFIYDGSDTVSANSPLLFKYNNCYQNSNLGTLFASALNATGELTIRFKTAPRDTNNRNTHSGFHFNMACEKPCERSTPIIDSIFDRVDLATGEVVGHGKIHMIPSLIDTIFYTYTITVNDSLGQHLDTIQTDSIIRFDTVSMIPGALLCQGQGVIFHAHGEYTHNTGYYTPSDNNTHFNWTLGSDYESRIGLTAIQTNVFQNTECYPVSLQLEDMNGCKSTLEEFQVRVAQNPVKTIFDLDAICNNDSLLVNVGYDGDNGTLTLKKIIFQQEFSQVNNDRNFIPDGPYCDIQCFSTPVEFGDFTPGKKIKSASEICSICINYEHTYMGDYRVAIRCPSYNASVSSTAGQAILKFGKFGTGSTCDPLATADSPDGVSAGGPDNTGWPHSSSSGCDSLNNPFGIGLDYCWSRNGAYTLITGDPADAPIDDESMYISYTRHTITSPVGFPMIPTYFNSPYGGTTPNPVEMTTRTPSNHQAKTDYYRPASDFSELVGCPLNGTWEAVICDFWGGDNGWVFNWGMDICGQRPEGSCEYQVGIDSVLWLPDTNRNDKWSINHEGYRDSLFHNGVYSGIRINPKRNDATASYISSPDTAGDFRIKLSIYDEFGCQWDTATHITSVYTPIPNLGRDTILCGVQSTMLDASDRYTNSTGANYSFLWEPYGQTTPIIETTPNAGRDVTYIVEVKNEMNTKMCVARDTIIVAVKPQPIPNFDPGMYPLEGCEPLTVNFTNTTTDGYKYQWVFGDGTYSTLMSPSHTYAAGSYDLKYYVESDGGCKDSLIFKDLITVFPQPHAAFSWEPTFPTVLHPTITLANNTTPDDGSNLYFWEIQYDKNNPYSVETLRDRNPSYTWTTDDGSDVSGNYNVRLITRSDNYGPSGHHVQCGDTIENTILIINDNLQFPNMVTPNGDGFNDVFVIKNLVEGLAFPINKLEIFDKWGSRVFHAENISKYEEFWDPARTNTPSGTYFYRFSGKGYKGNIEHNGVIEVLK